MTGGRRGARPAVIGDVARLAGVSNQTVSRVLNERPNVRPETRERVLDAIRRLDYRPNLMARGLVRRQAHAIGVISFDSVLFGPASTLLGIGRAARGAGYGVTIATPESFDRGSIVEAVADLTSHTVAGVITVFAARAAATSALLSLPAGLPAVAVEAAPDDSVPAVRIDQAEGVRMAVEHLLRLGHSTVWHVSGPRDRMDAQARIEAWRTTLEEAGRVVPRVVPGDWSAESGYQAGLELAERPGVTAVFAANDHMALGLLRAFHERGIRVPGDVSVVGFDDIPEAGYLIPPLTTVRPDHEEVGRRAVEVLLRLIDGGDGGPVEAPHVVPALVRRASTAPAPG
ncbi:LacI family transcriptional regulator [Thermocatellispora tengchongensis]|uniref:LacI family transcriptional regulator n=1 Tax=Thermocatellispora tengchongensis TaxID=1073253 RepID=A0A840PAR1_9ACTN|nr:LacI family DNA-binding transcriptional regulator [Thermocatellispora tengchongensis]MBB5134490.1 LacI family transcriptional regulator [Thermocatellispora tengchongensis]